MKNFLGYQGPASPLGGGRNRIAVSGGGSQSTLPPIPVKAGIQFSLRSWIPAFAGMSGSFISIGSFGKRIVTLAATAMRPHPHPKFARANFDLPTRGRWKAHTEPMKVRHSGAGKAGIRSPSPREFLDSGFALRAPRNDKQRVTK